MKNKIFNLKNTTFIIPIYIDSDDRFNNAVSVLGFLNKNFKTNIIIHELITDRSKLDFLERLHNLNISHITEEISGKNYHRTIQLNEMLSFVKTDVVCNYDIDVLLPITSYIISEKLLEDDIFDVVYPYGFGKYQLKIEKEISLGGVIIKNNRDAFNKDFLISKIEEDFLSNDRSEYGHCMFFRTDSYRRIGGENENFISYGPEDVERYNRCERFGLRIYRIKDYVYHFEHDRTPFSNKENPDFDRNNNLFTDLENMNESEYISYYKSQKYVEKYDFNISKLSQNINDDMYICYDFDNKKEVNKKIDISTVQSNTVTISNPITVRKNFCSCGEEINKVKYNYCPKCNRIY